MNKHLTEVMQRSWKDWHGDTPEDEIPSVNLSYEKGFKAAIEYLKSVNRVGETYECYMTDKKSVCDIIHED